MTHEKLSLGLLALITRGIAIQLSKQVSDTEDVNFAVQVKDWINSLAELMPHVGAALQQKPTT